MAPDPKLLARSSPAGLAWVASHGLWVPADHLMLLSEKLVEVATGRCPRLMVFMPPRHGKSELISKYMPAWFLGRFPEQKVMLASYADTFAAHWGRHARDVLDEFGPQIFGVTVDPETRGGGQWELEGHQGIMVTAGVGGGLTGKGANLLIIDDPVKNADEAQSQKTRDSHHDWWKSTARTRLQKGAGVILVMTRWHEDDLAGRLLADQVEGGDKWEVIKLEGLCENEADPLGRGVGDALWPEMFDEEALLQTKRAMGLYWFTAMYQQSPAPAEGMLFKKANFRYWRGYGSPSGQPIEIMRDEGIEVFDPEYGMKFSTVDVASSEKEQADYTVVSTWLVTVNRDLLLWDRERVQFQGPDLPPLLRRVYAEHRPSIIGIERLGHGLNLVQQLIREGLPIVRLEPDRDKISRALPAAARMEEHRVYFPKDAPWLGEWEHELLMFPNATNDDQVDTLAYAALQLPDMGSTVMTSGLIQRSQGKTITGGILSASF